MHEIESAKECLSTLKKAEIDAKHKMMQAFKNKEKIEALYQNLTKSNFLPPTSLMPLTLLKDELNQEAINKRDVWKLTKISKKKTTEHIIILENRERINELFQNIDSIIQNTLKTRHLAVFELCFAIFTLGDFLNQCFIAYGAELDGFKTGIKAEDIGCILLTNRFLFASTRHDISEEYGKIVNCIDDCTLQLLSDWGASTSYDKSDDIEKRRMLKIFDNFAKGKQAYLSFLFYQTPPANHQPSLTETEKYKPFLQLFCLAGQQVKILSNVLQCIESFLEKYKYKNLFTLEPLPFQLENSVKQLKAFDISLPDFLHKLQPIILKLNNRLILPSHQSPNECLFTGLTAATNDLEKINQQVIQIDKKKRAKREITHYQNRFFKKVTQDFTAISDNYIDNTISESELEINFFNIYNHNAKRKLLPQLNPALCNKNQLAHHFHKVKAELDHIKANYP